MESRCDWPGTFIFLTPAGCKRLCEQLKQQRTGLRPSHSVVFSPQPDGETLLKIDLKLEGERVQKGLKIATMLNLFFTVGRI